MGLAPKSWTTANNRAAAEELAHAAGIHDDVVTDRDIPGLKEVVEFRIGCRIDQNQSVGAGVQEFAEHGGFLRVVGLLGTGDDQDAAVRGHAVIRDQVDGFRCVVFFLQAGVYLAEAVLRTIGQGPFSVAGDETDFFGLVAGDFHDRAGNVFFADLAAVRAGIQMILANAVSDDDVTHARGAKILRDFGFPLRVHESHI